MRKLKLQTSRITSGLTELPTRLAAAFAAAVAERQLPNYAAYVERSGRGSFDILIGALNDLWDDLEHPSGDKEELRSHIDQCESLLSGKGHYEEGWSFAKNAIWSTQYALHLWLDGQVQNAIWATDCAIETLYHSMAIPIGGAEMRTIDPEEHEELIDDPLMRAEFRREHQDIDDLARGAGSEADQREAISKVRRRAQTDALRFFDREAASKSLGLS
jgi:hypothetical protein